jgi:hypothetical protein
MTLIIGTISKNSIVLTSDGLSTPNPLTGRGVSSSDYQKIFPLLGTPVAIAHYGLNILGKREVSEVVGGFAAQYAELIQKSSVIDIAKTFVEFVKADVQLTLNDPTNEGIIGFWITGFSPKRSKPKLYEIYWPNQIIPKSCKGLVIVGDGKEFIMPYLGKALGPFHPDQVYAYKGDYVRQYHDRLYNAAEAEQMRQGKRIFGGSKHQLTITRKECSWVIGPS